MILSKEERRFETMNMVVVNCRCPFCGTMSSILCEETALLAYERGALIQEAFSDMDVCSRETLISGMCRDCQATFFEEDDDDCDDDTFFMEDDDGCDGECDVCCDTDCPSNINFIEME